MSNFEYLHTSVLDKLFYRGVRTCPVCMKNATACVMYICPVCNLYCHEECVPLREGDVAAYPADPDIGICDVCLDLDE
jgi:hypothetical protein